MNRIATIMLYGFYAFLAVVVFLYLLFPSQTARDLVMAQIAQANPDLNLRVDEVHPVFPPGLKLAPVSVAYAGTPVLKMEHVKVIPGLFSLLGSQKQFRFDGPVGVGSLKGHAGLNLDEPEAKVKLTLTLNGIAVEELEALRQLLPATLSGRMTAYVDFDSHKGTGGTANINVDITPARVVFQTPLLGLQELEFSQIQSEVTLTPRMLQIKSFDTSGTQIESRTTGSIVFRQPLQHSRINLSCNIRPQAGFIAEQKDTMIGALLATPAAQQRGVLVRIAGTLEKPSYVVR